MGKFVAIYDTGLYHRWTVTLAVAIDGPHHLPQVLSNLVNYKTFGFTKIVPRVGPEKFEAVVTKSYNSAKALDLWKDVGNWTSVAGFPPKPTLCS